MTEPTYVREHTRGFGPYLRALREGRGLSLRDAAAQLGASAAKIQKMEAGGRFRAPSLDLLHRIADFYGQGREEVLAAAGFRVLSAEGAGDLDTRIRRIVRDELAKERP